MRTFVARTFGGAQRAGLVAAGLVALAGAAEAQSFLQNLFGIGQPQPRVDQPMQRPGVPAMSMPARPGFTPGFYPSGREFSRYSPQSLPNESRQAADGDEPSAASSSGKYRTVCVRSCDGYYFPISNSATRARFMRDSAQCRASCGDEARLYYLPASSDNMSTMLDLAGRSYLRMPNAFKYRKSLINGCSCKPMPWSEAELLRHKQYAAEAVLAEAQRKAAEEVEIARRLELDKIVPVAVAQAMNNQAGRDLPGTSPSPRLDVADVPHDGSQSKPDPEATTEPPLESERPRPAARANRFADGTGSTRAAQRPQRQPAVARVSAPSVGAGGSWFPTSGQKYTWPGDPPRR